ncbi:DUF4013 domain-containing protein [Methanothrix sp.]|uniref:DUF4013 domain-containing protein n=1 Tax=Methanothrix sp. TaxID=90426 RepID=UPI0034E2F921
MRWLLLIICCILFPFFLGYMLEVMRGRIPAPELENWGKLFMDGLKLLIVGLIYAIPVIILAILLIGGSILALGARNPAISMAAIGTIMLGMFLVFIVAIIIGLFATIGYVRFARTDRFGEAFNFNAITAHIGRIGWVSYVLAIVLISVSMAIVNMIISLVPLLGGLINFILLPAYGLFFARYITLVYDSVPA